MLRTFRLLKVRKVAAEKAELDVEVQWQTIHQQSRRTKAGTVYAASV